MTVQIEPSGESMVFVVDDDPAVRCSFEELITSMGLTSVCFSTAEKFLNSYDRLQHGCLVVDVRMPGMNGIELQHRLAADEISIPVIFVTGNADVAMCAEAMKRGAIDFLEKPCRPAQLRESIERAIRADDIHRRKVECRVRLTDSLERLSSKELDVLKGLLTGKQNKEIAAALDISLRSVQLRRSGLMRKMGVESMPELFALLAPVWKDEFLLHPLP